MAENAKLAVSKKDGAQRRTDPLWMINALQDEMERFWRDPFGTGVFPFARRGRTNANFIPRMDVYEQDGAIVVKAELPGLKKEDVQVEVDGDGLIIRGENRAERETKDEAYYRSERTFGSFFRRLPLPFDVQPDQIQASMTDGVLEVRIPRPAEAMSEPKKIPVA
jgi:HSP20 family protein